LPGYAELASESGLVATSSHAYPASPLFRCVHHIVLLFAFAIPGGLSICRNVYQPISPAFAGMPVVHPVAI
jgi:hypothetical protein